MENGLKVNKIRGEDSSLVVLKEVQMRSVEGLILANTVNRENSQNSQDRIVWHLEIESVEGWRSVWDGFWVSSW